MTHSSATTCASPSPSASPRARPTSSCVVANWPDARREHWRTLLRARAIENQAYVAGVNRVGDGGRLHYAGDSALVSPSGETLAEGDDRERVLLCEVDVKKVAEIRARFPSWAIAGRTPTSGSRRYRETGAAAKALKRSDTSGDGVLGHGEGEAQVALALRSEDDARNGRDAGAVEQRLRGRARVGAERRPGSSGRGTAPRAERRARNPRRAVPRRGGPGGGGSPPAPRQELVGQRERLERRPLRRRRDAVDRVEHDGLHRACASARARARSPRASPSSSRSSTA